MDKTYLQQAVALSAESPEAVGCGVIIVQGGIVLAATYNSQKTDNVAVNHAEIKAVIAANRKTGSRKLTGAIAYCSCEPCAMCLVALSYANVGQIVYYKRMIDLFPEDPQSQFDSNAFIAGLNFVPRLLHIAQL